MTDTTEQSLTGKLDIEGAKRCFMTTLAFWAQTGNHDWQFHITSAELGGIQSNDANTLWLEYHLGGTLTFRLTINIHYHRICLNDSKMIFRNEQDGTALAERRLHNIQSLAAINEHELELMMTEAIQNERIDARNIDTRSWNPSRILENILAAKEVIDDLLVNEDTDADHRVQMMQYIHTIESPIYRATDELLSEDTGQDNIETAIIKSLAKTIMTHRLAEQTRAFDHVLLSGTVNERIFHIIVRAFCEAMLTQNRSDNMFWIIAIEIFRRNITTSKEDVHKLEFLIQFIDQLILSSANPALSKECLSNALNALTEKYRRITTNDPSLQYEFDLSLLYRTCLHADNWHLLDSLFEANIPYVEKYDRLHLTGNERILIAKNPKLIANIIKQCQRVEDLPSGAILAAEGITRLHEHFSSDNAEAFALLAKWSVSNEDIEPLSLLSQCQPWQQTTLMDCLSSI